MTKKRQITHICGNPITIYKKGKNHRAFICSECGLVATNPVGLGSVAKRVAKGVIGEIPGASLVMEGLGLASDIMTPKAKETPQFRNPINRYTTEERVRDAFKGGK